jgi:L-alanine-DL-glutamate epimerase-like enolase superfamily enzyme
MNRRDVLKGAGALGAAAMTDVSAGGADAGGGAGPEATIGSAGLRTEVVRLKLRHTWTTTMSSSDYRDTLYVRYTRGGLTGVGEGAPIVRYHESAVEGERALQPLRELVESADPMAWAALEAEVAGRLPGQYAARAAVNIAVLDWVGQKLGVPVYRLFGLDATKAPATTFSIGIDTPEITRQKVREAEPYPILKIKVGLDTDEATIEAVRSVTRKPLRVDANEGWKDRETAARKIAWLETQGVEFIEQPMPAAMLDEQRWLRSRVHMPILADEACLRSNDIPKIADAYDGIVVKVDKAGGLVEVLRSIHTARSFGLKVMLGCMVSSSVAITAAAHLSPLVDYADLDGNLLIGNDPYTGVLVRDGRLVLPAGPGLGLSPAA